LLQRVCEYKPVRNGNGAAPEPKNCNENRNEEHVNAENDGWYDYDQGSRRGGLDDIKGLNPSGEEVLCLNDEVQEEKNELPEKKETKKDGEVLGLDQYGEKPDKGDRADLMVNCRGSREKENTITNRSNSMKALKIILWRREVILNLLNLMQNRGTMNT